MPVIALATLVIVPHHASPSGKPYIEPVLQSMGTLGTRLWQVPDQHLQDGAIREHHLTVDDDDKGGFHIIYYTIWYKML